MTVGITQSAATIFAPTQSNGAARRPSLADAQRWGVEVERLLDATLSASATFATVTDANASLNWPANTMAWVVADPNPLFTGLYRKNGASGGGSWTRIGALPYNEVNVNLATEAAVRAEAAQLAAESAAASLFLAFATRTAVTVSNIPAGVTFIRTGGYRVLGDGGSALYIKVGSEPSHLGKIQSADGAWWELSEGDMYKAECWGVNSTETAADNTARINSCLARVGAAGGGTVILPRGVLNFNAWSAITANNLVVKGQGRFNNGTTLRFNNATGNDVTIEGCQYSGIEDVYFEPAVRKTSGFSIVMQGGCYQCFAERINGTYVFNGILVTSSTECRVRQFNLMWILGDQGIQFTGTSVAPSFKLACEDLLFNNPYPLAYPSVATGVRTWASTTAYNLGEVVFVNSRVLQCVVAGTSGASAPNAIPGTGTADAFTTQIVDGTARWRFVCNDIRWVVFNNWSYTLRLSNCGLINGVQGIYMQADTSPSTSFPMFLFCEYVEIDHPYKDGVVLERGLQAKFSQLWVSSSLDGNCMVFGPNHQGAISVTNSNLTTAAFHGIAHNAGPTNVQVTNSEIADNSQRTNNTSDGVSIAANASRFVYQGNTIGDVQGNGSNRQRYGVAINTGTSNNYVVADNITVGNVTGGVVDNGSGVSKRVENNV